ncbi:MAG: hypothetical protein ACM3O5_06800 [Betaproteobacteria bacterium]
MRRYSALVLSVLALAACQTVPEKTAQPEEARERCDTVLTGSRIPQCNRGDVRVVTRENIERNPVDFNRPCNNAECNDLPRMGR